jgi:glucokinase
MTGGAGLSSEVALGIDVGGTKVALGLVDAAGQLRQASRIETGAASTAADLLPRVAEEARRLAAEAGPAGVTAVGVGMCELVDPAGEVRTSVRIPWSRKQIVDAFASLAPVVVEADVRAAALAEARIGAGSGFDSFAFVTVGTGISSCLVWDGVPYAGVHGTAELLGSAPLTVTCPHCRLTERMSLEGVAAGPALAQQYSRLSGVKVGGAEDVLAAAERGDAAATGLLRESSETLGSFIALLVNIVDLQAVVIGGGLGAAGGAFWEAVARSVRAHIYGAHAPDVPIVMAELGASAGVVGAGLLGLLRARPVAPASVGGRGTP